MRLIVHYRGVQQRKLWLVLAGAALLGSGVNLRETIGFYAPWLVLAPFVCGWKFRRREILISWRLVSCCLLVRAWLVRIIGSSLTRTTAGFGMAGASRCDEETARHPVTIANILSLLPLLFHQRAAGFRDDAVCADGSSGAKHRIHRCCCCGWSGFCEPAAVFQLQHDGQLALFSDRLPAIAPLGAYWMLRLARRRFED